MDSRYCLRKVAEGPNRAFFIADSDLSPDIQGSDEHHIDRLLLLRF
jgi:hypothetical protein